MESNAKATVTIVSTEDFVNRLPRTPAAPGIFKKIEPPSAVGDPFAFRKQRGKLVEAVKRTRKAAAGTAVAG